MTTSPKLFISYSWTSEEHERWVIDVATALRDAGVDVILDKWDLREGHDAHHFMEQMVVNPGVKKVAMICDRKYAEKANDRAGGVGTEAQIISAEIYAKTDQDKFVAVLSERDSEGKPFLPAYYKSRIYIDLSS
ncbi:MAG: SEFIR domain-containing protein, partial [Candidatus Binatia bacterium]